jgi:predicted glycoside hydrolase/deacetylase ChbG (UPF0249 family)
MHTKHKHHTWMSLLILTALVSAVSCTTSEGGGSQEHVDETRLIILTADDFSASRGIDDGVYQILEMGVPLGVSAMTTYQRSEGAIGELHQRYPDTRIGIHLSVTAGWPLSEQWKDSEFLLPDGSFLPINQIIPHLNQIPKSLWEAELRAQIEMVQNLGIVVDHLSSQDNLMQMYTPALEVTAALAQEKGIPVRSPLPVSQTLLQDQDHPIEEVAMGYLSQAASQYPFKVLVLSKYTRLPAMKNNQKILAEHQVSSPTYAAGGLYHNASFQAIYDIVTALPPGESAEIVFHFGLETEPDEEVPHGVNEGYYHLRYQENNLVNTSYRELIDLISEFKVRLIGYEDL